MTPEEEAEFRGETAEDQPLLLGPGPVGSSPSQREQRLKELLGGQTPSERLPLVDTDPGVAHDPELHARLTRIVVDRPLGRVEVRFSPPKRLSGTLDREQANRITIAMRAGFQNCYRRALMQDGEVPWHQQFDVELLVNGDGTVASVTVEGKQEPSLWDFFACAKRRVQGSRFEPPPSEPSRLRFSVETSHIAPGSLAYVK